MQSGWPIWTQKPNTKLPQCSLFNPDSIQPSSLVSYAKSVEELGQKELTTLRMTVLSARSPTKTSLKDSKASSKKRKVRMRSKKVLFSDYVVEKESNDIYLTRMNIEEEEDPEWKSKLIVDRRILDRLTIEVHSLIDRFRNPPIDISTTSESIYGLHSKADTTPLIKLPAPKNSARSKRSSLAKIFEQRILQLIGPEECIFETVQLPDWNKYLPGIFCFLNIKRDVLTQLLRETETGGSYIISLFNHSHIPESYQTNDIFEEHSGTLTRCSAPMTLKNGKMEVWNCILDKFLRQYTGRSVFKTRDFLEAILGVPVKEQNTMEIQLVSDFLAFYTKNCYVFAELKNGCCFVEGLKVLQIDGQEYQFVIIATFESDNIQCSLKYSPLYQKCSYLQKLLVKDFGDDYRVLVLMEDFKFNFPKLLVSCRFGSDLVISSIMIGASRVAFIESEYAQNIILRLTPQTQAEMIVAMAELYMDESDVHFKKKVKGQEVIYHRIHNGYYEIQTSTICKLEIFSQSDLKIVEETVPEQEQEF